MAGRGHAQRRKDLLQPGPVCDMHITSGSPMLQIVVRKQLPWVGLELAALGILEKRLDLSPREVRWF